MSALSQHWLAAADGACLETNCKQVEIDGKPTVSGGTEVCRIKGGFPFDLTTDLVML